MNYSITNKGIEILTKGSEIATRDTNTSAKLNFEINSLKLKDGLIEASIKVRNNKKPAAFMIHIDTGAELFNNYYPDSYKFDYGSGCLEHLCIDYEYTPTPSVKDRADDTVITKMKGIRRGNFKGSSLDVNYTNIKQPRSFKVFKR